MGGEDFWKGFRTDVLPLGGPGIRTEQGGRVIHVMELFDGLVAEHAALPFVPLGNDIPDKAPLRIVLDLLQAILAAPLALGPPGTLIQPESGLVEKSAEAGFGC